NEINEWILAFNFGIKTYEGLSLSDTSDVLARSVYNGIRKKDRLDQLLNNKYLQYTAAAEIRNLEKLKKSFEKKQGYLSEGEAILKKAIRIKKNLNDYDPENDIYTEDLKALMKEYQELEWELPRKWKDKLKIKIIGLQSKIAEYNRNIDSYR